ncbi:MAG: hypothetical protein IIW01_08865, partial [Thermoguttaceae bacterium]|nr:hypothetical protein [Thermoguttaceae bacterium]
MPTQETSCAKNFAYSAPISTKRPSPSADFQNRAYSLYVVSDYPRSCFGSGDMEHIVERVREDGAGLLML